MEAFGAAGSNATAWRYRRSIACADSITGGRGRNELLGGDRRDTICGGPAADHINGGPNRDRSDGDATIDRVSTNDTYVSTRVTRFCPLF